MLRIGGSGGWSRVRATSRRELGVWWMAVGLGLGSDRLICPGSFGAVGVFGVSGEDGRVCNTGERWLSMKEVDACRVRLDGSFI